MRLPDARRPQLCTIESHGRDGRVARRMGERVGRALAPRRSSFECERVAPRSARWIASWALFAVVACTPAHVEDFVEPTKPPEIQILTAKRDPFGHPRPASGETSVPTNSSIYFELGVSPPNPRDRILPRTLSVTLAAQTGEIDHPVSPNLVFGRGYSVITMPRKNRQGHPVLSVYIESEKPLLPETRYAVSVDAQTLHGHQVSKDNTWRFTTSEGARVQPVRFDFDLEEEAVDWRGGFFTGFCKASFCTSYDGRVPGYELMAEARKSSPSAWSLQRDFWMTGTQRSPTIIPTNLPNIVRELETRRVVEMEWLADGTWLRLEDFFGHEQYGIPSARPTHRDYQVGDTVLISDGVKSAQARVRTVARDSNSLLITSLPGDASNWKLAYDSPLPSVDDPNAPGLFAFGGIHLLRQSPPGTPYFYWDRLDREWDLAHQVFHRRLMPNFVDAPGDVSIDAMNGNTAKDYLQLHEVARRITGHIIDRYGPSSLDFVWSVFNEPDLFWRGSWQDLQRFYDYCVDGILRAFEDRGYDSNRVFVGGLELGAIFGSSLRIHDFLVHCSPSATSPDALSENAAYADRRLHGKRSRRVDELCSANDGRGSPCDFVSVHSYNSSELMAEKLARAKEIALEIDPVFYERMWVNSHESCPGWIPSPDVAAQDSYLGNGYFATWCADVARRQLLRAKQDPRFGFGETLLTLWPWPNQNFRGSNACTRMLHVDDDEDGIKDRTVTVPMQIFHFLTLLGGMQDRYWVLPEYESQGAVVSGFASMREGEVNVVVYAHNSLDVQSRSQQEFEIDLTIHHLPPGSQEVRQVRFDKDNNSYYWLASALRDRVWADHQVAVSRLLDALEAIQGRDPEQQVRGLETLQTLGQAAESLVPSVQEVFQKSSVTEVRQQAFVAVQRLTQPAAYPADVIERIQSKAALEASQLKADVVDGKLELRIRVPSNGACFVSVGSPGT